jgi:CTP:molybdopterin cytidylyltransferase MocA
MGVAALLLAASGGDFEGPAALLPWNRTPLVDHVLTDMAAWPVDELIVVIGMDEARVLSKAQLPGATVVIDPGWKEGSASALRAGLDMLTRLETYDAVVVRSVLVPDVRVDVVEQLVARFGETERSAVVPKYRYVRGEPVLIGKELWGRFMGTEGEANIQQVLSTHPDWVDEVWVDRLAPHTIDTLDDLNDVRRRH